MKSKVTISVDHDNRPVLQVEYNESEDVRDTLVKIFIETFGHDSSWASFRFVDVGHMAAGKQMVVIRPITPVECLEHQRLLTVWVQEMISKGYFPDHRPSSVDKLRQFNKGMLIETGGDHYKCICADEETAVFGKITKWNAEECRVSHEITFCYSQDKWSNTDYRVISPLVPVIID